MMPWVLRVAVPVFLLASMLAGCSSRDPRSQADPPAKPAPVSVAPSAADAGYDDTSLFTRKLPARAGDWLERFHEPGQTFGEYERSSPVKPTAQRRKLVLQPLGVFAPADDVLLAKLAEHMGIFFGLPVERRAPLSLASRGRRTRRADGRSWPQYLTGAIMDDVLRPRLPDDAVVYLGITTADLYPGSEWNFVFGEARFEQRVGVYSVGRMFEKFDGGRDDEASLRRGLARSAAILTHETGHAFGIAHCTAFECVMNGTNSLEELDRQFAEPCPVCLHKLVWNIGLDPIARYQRLREFYRREGITELADWIDRRLAQTAR